MSLEKFVVFVLSISGCINAQETIDCAETIKGWRNQNEEVPLKFTASNDYSLVYLEGCPSTHDIWLEILDSNGNSIADADDRNEHGVEQSECGNKWAGDITIPNHVKRGEEYTFLVKGYENRHGDYTVTLICQNEDANTTTTTATPTSTPTPTPAPTTTTTTTTNDDDSHSAQCVERIRKPWHLISQQERDLFVNGWMELYRNGKLSIFTETHGDSSIDKHTNAAFLPWHRFFIWELETQFRSLGGEWECFALPYWDWSYDIAEHGWNINEWQILNSGLGGPGNEYNDYCVDNDGWDNYIPSTLTSNGAYNVPCLRRKICGESNEASCSFLGSASQLHSLLTDEPYYGDDDNDYDYRYRLELKHGSAHLRIGGNGHLGYLGKATDDPIFFLIHSFVDFQYSLWQDCRNHELVSKEYITEDMYNGHVYEIDDELDFGVLEEQDWSSINNYNDITVRDMHSIQDWNVIYDKGDYFDRAKVEDDASICKDQMNPLWFTDDYNILRRRLKGKDDKNNKKNKFDMSENEEYSRDIYDKITKKYGCQKSSSMEEKTDLFKTWAQMDCQFQNIGSNCVRPKYWDDSSDMELNRYVPGTGQYDIDITLDELIEKVNEYECMVQTRIMYYQWAKQNGNLKGLARGDYDTFCDHGFISKQPAERQCVANQGKKRRDSEKVKSKSKGKGKGKGKASYEW